MKKFLWNRFGTDAQPIIDAIDFAEAGHASIGQKRKYTAEPYIVHPVRVLQILLDHGVVDIATLTAAPMHDLREDVEPKNSFYGASSIMFRFGIEPATLVDELTDVFTPENYPKINRKARKILEADRIAGISDSALKIKLGDLIDNSSDILANDKEFAMSVYLPEKRMILWLVEERILNSGDDVLIALFNTAKNQVK